LSTNPWEVIRRALTRKPKETRDYRLEQLFAIVKRGKTLPSERIEPSETLMQRAELLYRLEPLIFSGVNKLTRRITGCKIYFTGGSDEENQKALQFCEESRLIALLPHLVKDAFIYGFGVAEIARDGNKIVLNQIDPKEFDFIREGSEIALDEQGNIKGFVWKRGGEEQELKPNEVLLIRFYTLGEYCLGISPVEAAFKAAWIKLNLEESLGEAIYRHGFPIVKFKIGTPEEGPWHDITPEKIKQAKKYLADLESGSELLLPWWMDAEILAKRGEFGNIHEFLELLGMEILAAFEIPKGFGVETKGLGGRAVEELDFEKTVIAFQEELKRQIEEQLLFPYYKEVGFLTRPRLTFTEYAPELQNIKLRRLSAYAKHGLITRTDELENALRAAEGFPLKQRKVKDTDQCIFGLGKCPVRLEESMPLDKLVAFCNICTIRLQKEKEIKDSKQDEQPGRPA
jgi:hypothetical protein